MGDGTVTAAIPSAAHTTDDVLLARWIEARAFCVIGGVAVVAGGVVAAVTRPLDFDLGSWVAAFLVLVGGVGQIALGGGQSWLVAARTPGHVVRAELLTWNLGSVLTIVGTLVEVPAVTTVGGVLLAVALALFFNATRESSGSPRWLRLLYRGFVGAVLISIPIGLVLAFLRH